MFKPFFQWCSPSGPRAPLSVLIFHRVLPEPDPLFPLAMHARQFDVVCGWLARWFNVLPLEEAVTRLKAGTLPARAACLTFDDGYADNLQVAVPILKHHDLRATFFVATGFLDGGRMWNDTLIETVRACPLPLLDLSALGLSPLALGSMAQRRSAVSALISYVKYRPHSERADLAGDMARLARVALPTDLMLTSLQVKTLHRAGMSIGAHTVTHPILAMLGLEQAQQEISGSRRYLECLLDEPVSLFAYPNGKPGADYSVQNVEQVRRLGFLAAVSTQAGITKMGDDEFQLSRFTPWNPGKLRFAAGLLANMGF